MPARRRSRRTSGRTPSSRSPTSPSRSRRAGAHSTNAASWWPRRTRRRRRSWKQASRAASSRTAWSATRPKSSSCSRAVARSTPGWRATSTTPSRSSRTGWTAGSRCCSRSSTTTSVRSGCRLPGSEAEAAETLRRPSVQLPLIMIVEYALAQLLMSWGVRPAALVGHSMGENTAACLAGVMSFEDCIGLVHLRGTLFDTVPAGGMLSVPMAAGDLAPLLGDELDLASVNAPGLSVASGPQAALDALQARLAAQGVESQRIPIDVAAHSRMLDPILGRFRDYLMSIKLSPPAIPFVSNRSGRFITDAEATDPDYWVGHLRGTVRFADCVSTLAASPDRVYLEVGPGKALSSLTQAHGAVASNQVLSALRHPEERIADDAYFLGLLGRLWAVGVAVRLGADLGRSPSRAGAASDLRLPALAALHRARRQPGARRAEPADAPGRRGHLGLAAAVAAAPRRLRDRRRGGARRGRAANLARVRRWGGGRFPRRGAAARRRPAGRRGPRRRRLRPHRRRSLRAGARARPGRLRRAGPRPRRARHGAEPCRPPLAGHRPRDLPPGLELLPSQPGAGVLRAAVPGAVDRRREPAHPDRRHRGDLGGCPGADRSAAIPGEVDGPRTGPGRAARAARGLVQAARPRAPRHRAAVEAPPRRPAPGTGRQAGRDRGPGARGGLRDPDRHRRGPARAEAVRARVRPRPPAAGVGAGASRGRGLSDHRRLRRHRAERRGNAGAPERRAPRARRPRAAASAERVGRPPAPDRPERPDRPADPRRSAPRVARSRSPRRRRRRVQPRGDARRGGGGDRAVRRDRRRHPRGGRHRRPAAPRQDPGRHRGRAFAEDPRDQGPRRALPRRQPRLDGAVLLDQHDHRASRAGRLRGRQRVPQRLRQEPARRADAGGGDRLGGLERGRHGRERLGRAHRRPARGAARAGGSAAARRRHLRRRGAPVLRGGLLGREPLGDRRAPDRGGRRAAARHRLPRACGGGPAGERRGRRVRGARPALPPAADRARRRQARRQGAPRPIGRGLPHGGAERGTGRWPRRLRAQRASHPRAAGSAGRRPARSRRHRGALPAAHRRRDGRPRLAAGGAPALRTAVAGAAIGRLRRRRRPRGPAPPRSTSSATSPPATGCIRRCSTSPPAGRWS